MQKISRSQVSSEQVESASDKIWEHIKNVQLDLFSLPNQFVNKHCTPTTVEPSKLYLTLSTPAVLPALEEALKGHYSVYLLEKWTVVEPV